MKKALIVASVASMIDQFNMQNIKLLIDNGYKVDVACNCKVGNTISDERVEQLIRKLKSWDVNVYHVPIPRKVADVQNIVKSIKIVKNIIKNGNYEIMHSHSPIGSVVARIASCSERKNGLRVIYTVHGFHFYKRAPLKNWMVFFPIEWMFSWITDELITINKEDYSFARKHLHAKHCSYIPGVGINIDNFVLTSEENRLTKRTSLGLKDDEIFILSVGELNSNKNHRIVLEALSRINNTNCRYFIAGKGDNDTFLMNEAERLGVDLTLLGYRNDVNELLNAADIYVFPSFREGLSVALMEAMASGLPCIASNIRGNTDLICPQKGGFLCNPNSSDEFSSAIQQLSCNPTLCKKYGKYNQKRIEMFSMNRVLEKTKNIYFDKQPQKKGGIGNGTY